MVTWIRHRWFLYAPCHGPMAEAYVEKGSKGDEQLRQCFGSTREEVADGPQQADSRRLMNGWIRFG